jgi:hypothetical protein
MKDFEQTALLVLVLLKVKCIAERICHRALWTWHPKIFSFLAKFIAVIPSVRGKQGTYDSALKILRRKGRLQVAQETLGCHIYKKNFIVSVCITLPL